MRIIWTSSDPLMAAIARVERSSHAELMTSVYLDKKRLPNRFPVIVSRDGGVCREAFNYLYEVGVISGTTNGPETLRTYAESLCSWLTYSEENHVNWKSPTRRNVANYRNVLAGQGECNEGNGRKRCEKTTINLRLTVLVDFLMFSVSQEGELAGDSGRDGSGSIEKLFRLKKLKLRQSRKRAKTISKEGCKGILESLSFPHNIIFLWTISTAARIGTALRVTVGMARNLLSPQSNGYIEVMGKGGKLNRIFVPKILREETNRYIDMHRSLSQISGKKYSKGNPSGDALFLNSLGRPVTYDCYYKAFKRACKKCAIKANPHLARATYASNVNEKLKKLKNRGADVDPLKVTQGLLNHADSATTEIYLNEIFMPNMEVLEVLDELGREVCCA